MFIIDLLSVNIFSIYVENLYKYYLSSNVEANQFFVNSSYNNNL